MAHSEHHEVSIPPELDGERLDRALAALLSQYSRSALKVWIDAGAVQVNGLAARPRTRVHHHDCVALTATLASGATLMPQGVAFDVLYSDDDLIVINKPAGLVVHPGAGNPDHTLVNGLLARFPELDALPRAGLVHRIDKDTSGLLLVARSPHSYQQLVRALAAREISRSYTAVVTGTLIAGDTINAAISRDPNQRTRMRVSPGGREAITHYRVKAKFRAHSLLDIQLETGRTHQIRVHFAWRGHALVGDSRYGARPRPPRAASAELRAILESFPRQALHAARLAFSHPLSAAALLFEAPQPDDMAALIAALEHDLSANPP